MHWLGVAGIPRRIPDYSDAFYTFNKIASWGSIKYQNFVTGTSTVSRCNSFLIILIIKLIILEKKTWSCSKTFKSFF